MIGIIDYGMGNLRSVQKAFEALGASAIIMAGPAELSRIDRLILPGVGAFADGMDQLRQRGWVEPIRQFVASGRPFLGICLGMQLIFEGSEEDAPASGPPVPGLSILPGQVVKFRCAGEPCPAAGPNARLKVPHMGWNTLRWSRQDPLFAGLPQDASVYFVHGYYAQPVETPAAPITTAVADHGGTFTAALWRDNVWATQFHPEKSQQVGLKMLANFAAIPSAVQV